MHGPFCCTFITNQSCTQFLTVSWHKDILVDVALEQIIVLHQKLTSFNGVMNAMRESLLMTWARILYES